MLRSKVNENELSYKERNRKFKYEIQREQDMQILGYIDGELTNNELVNHDAIEMIEKMNIEEDSDPDGLMKLSKKGGGKTKEAWLKSELERNRQVAQSVKGSVYNASSSAGASTGEPGETTAFTTEIYQKPRLIREQFITDQICAIPESLQIDMKFQLIPTTG